MDFRYIIIIVCVILLIVISLWKRIVVRLAAKLISRNLEGAFQPDHIFRRVDAKEFPWLNNSFYDNNLAQLKIEEFEWLADIEDETLSKVFPNMRTFVRICLSPDRLTRAAIYEIVPGGPQGIHTQPPIQTRELISEASDGTTITTTTAPESRLLDQPGGSIRNNVSSDTPLDRMLEMHERSINGYIDLHYGVTLETISTFEEATAAWQKGIDRQRKRLKSGGGLNKREFMRIGGADKREVAEEVYDEMGNLRKKD